jgi:hypothetical protein
MSKKIRDSIFIIFIVLFLVLTTVISLYATGYKFNLRWPLRLNAFLVKTGMLVVSTEPTGAEIYLNDQPQTELSLNVWSGNYAATPAKIKNVLPGDYTLRLEKSGYWPWQKKITIDSGQTTFVENINLFRNDLPIFIATSTGGQLQLSSSWRYLYVPGGEKIINLSTEETQILPAADISGRWLKSVDRLSGAGRLYDPGNGATIDYRKIIGSEATNWHYEETTGRLYYQIKNSLNRLEADGRTKTALLSGADYLAYEPRGDYLFVVVSEQDKTTLRNYNLKTGKMVGQIILPSIGQYTLAGDGRPRLSLYDEKNRTLYLINPSDLADNPKTISPVRGWAWSGDNQLFYYNDWEIYYYDLNKNNGSLLTRVGEAITDLLLSPNREYLVFSTARSLNIIDLETGLATPIFTAEKISGAALDSKNNNLYFNANLGHNEGIYKLNLQ